VPKRRLELDRALQRRSGASAVVEARADDPGGELREGRIGPKRDERVRAGERLFLRIRREQRQRAFEIEELLRARREQDCVGEVARRRLEVLRRAGRGLAAQVEQRSRGEVRQRTGGRPELALERRGLVLATARAQRRQSNPAERVCAVLAHVVLAQRERAVGGAAFEVADGQRDARQLEFRVRAERAFERLRRGRHLVRAEGREQRAVELLAPQLLAALGQGGRLGEQEAGEPGRGEQGQRESAGQPGLRRLAARPVQRARRVRRAPGGDRPRLANGAQVVGEGLGRRIAPPAVLGQRGLDHDLEVAWRGRHARTQPRRLEAQNGPEQSLLCGSVERPHGAQQLVQRHAEREDVAAAVDRAAVARQTLGRHVGRRSVQFAGGRERGGALVEIARQAEIEHDHALVGRNHEVAGLDVAVHDAGLVRGVERAGGLLDQGAARHDLAPREGRPAAAGGDPLG
jgi:hypothetical protein